MLFIHSGTNDIKNKANIMHKIRMVMHAIKENYANEETEVVQSSFINRDDQDVEDEINEINKKLEKLCKGRCMRFIDNSNIKRSSQNTLRKIP